MVEISLWHGWAWQGVAGLGVDRQGLAEPGEARQGGARLGWARLGKARLGEAGQGRGNVSRGRDMPEKFGEWTIRRMWNWYHCTRPQGLSTWIHKSEVPRYTGRSAAYQLKRWLRVRLP